MQQDKIIKKALEEELNFSLSSGFNEQTMFRIYKEAERKKKQNFVLMLGCISAVSLGLIVLTIYLLKKYFSFNFSFRFQMPAFHLGALSQYYFSIYIAVIVLFLLFLDYFFRSFWNNKKLNKKGV
ncbi:MAG: hypothetical protein LBE82_00355 [Chitinophagaceae bacterium]|jgi:hypothetical protein|nr:hypothetical protein [Chitinophagaceae bacterium]